MRIRLILLFVVCLLVFSSYARSEPPFVVVLGTAQDAGAPQIGCMSPYCAKAWKNPALRKKVVSLGLVDPATGKRWIFEATPDLPSQFQMLKGVTADYGNGLSGIFLTHAHIGHYTGLMYLGRESINASGIPVYAMDRMARLLRKNAPWSLLVKENNISLKELYAGKKVRLSASLAVTPFLVPHRDEFSETVGFRIATPEFSLLFIPDIDKWEKWGTKLSRLVPDNDILLLDGTFFADGEIPRPISEVPHPFVTETMKNLSVLDRSERNKVYFIHFNHSNPLLQGDKDAILRVTKNGFRVAQRGQVFTFAGRR